MEGRERDALIRPVDGDVDHGVLVHVAQEELRLDDELLGLETCKPGRLGGHFGKREAGFRAREAD